MEELFTEFRLVLYVLIAFQLIVLGLSLHRHSRSSKINFVTILLLSVFAFAVNGALFYTENQMLTDLIMDADSLSFYLFLAVFALAILNPVLFKLRNKKIRRYNFY
ncbi:hypothetical protein [Lacticigenium naphthae]|uniref:hypothetical protein n=1 Tax=Lacticigenium naphthae TaxID=515351 RepID=UPI000414330A|nr:hypothetical protein [Lacticigenium naphthae]